MRYWLMKSEPTSFSFDDLLRCPNRITFWSGVRNYQARNFLRDEIKKGDGVLFYHSNAEPSAVIGTAKVVREGYPDTTQFDPKDHHFDATSDPTNPRWFMVDIQGEKKFKQPLPLEKLRDMPGLEKMELLRKGSRLSVQPVSAAEWKILLALGGI